eukprot:4970900-Amphidinium_carterae.1
MMFRTPVDEGMAKVVNRAFLSLVRTHYWTALAVECPLQGLEPPTSLSTPQVRQLETGDLRPGSDEAETLLTSVEVALSPLRVQSSGQT